MGYREGGYDAYIDDSFTGLPEGQGVEMEVLKGHRYGAARVVFHLLDGISRCVVKGPMTARVLEHLAEDWVASRRSEQAGAAVVDLSSAVVLFSLADLVRYSEPRFARRQMHEPPVAIVASPLHKQMFLDWAWRAAHYGVMRGVFLDPFEAVDWATRQAASLRAEAIYLASASARSAPRQRRA